MNSDKDTMRDSIKAQWVSASSGEPATQTLHKNPWHGGDEEREGEGGEGRLWDRGHPGGAELLAPSRRSDPPSNGIFSQVNHIPLCSSYLAVDASTQGGTKVEKHCSSWQPRRSFVRIFNARMRIFFFFFGGRGWRLDLQIQILLSTIFSRHAHFLCFRA